MRHRWRLLVAGTLGLVLFGVMVVWLTWPEVASLRDVNPGSTAFIERYLERTGHSVVNWTWVPASEISAHLMEATVVSEDLEFFSHDGFSRYEIDQAIRKAIRERERPRGASTITQQLAKNLWLSPSRNVLRKLRETVLTRQLERYLSKARILEIYLNVVEFGPGVFGAEAAARLYFEKSAADLTQRESAMLAASLPRPSQWHPGVASPDYARRVESLIARMLEVTFLDRRLGLPPDLWPDPPPDPPSDSTTGF